MSKNDTTAKAIARATRANAAKFDPYFGKRRSAGEMGRNKTKAAASKQACRGQQWS